MLHITKEINFLQKSFGLFNQTHHYSAILVQGEDFPNFLQALTTNDIKSVAIGKGQQNAILTKSSHILAIFFYYVIDKNSFLLFTSQSQQNILITTLNNFIFTEKLIFTVIENYHIECLIVDEKATKNLDALTPYLPKNLSLTEEKDVVLHVLNEKTFLLHYSLEAKSSWRYWFYLTPKKNSTLNTLIGKKYFSNETFESLRIENGIPYYQADFDDSTLILELGGLSKKIINDTKGCYPGQEVIARVKSRGGNVQRKLIGLQLPFEVKKFLRPKMSLKTAETKIGTLCSFTYSAALQSIIAFAYLKREYWQKDTSIPLILDENNHNAFIIAATKALPFINNDSPAANKLYQQGLEHFHQNQFEEARLCYEQALHVSDENAEVLEALAVLHERLGNTDKAIALNKEFAAANPQAVMAHANLSRLYMKKGLIEQAEDEKNKATLLEFKQTAIASQREKQEQLFYLKQKVFQTKQITMFNEVLDFDANDEVALFGLGKIFFDKKEYTEAEKYLAKVVRVKKDYSVAYMFLAKCYLKQNKLQIARETLQTGMEVAKKNGDMMPLNAMQSDRLMLEKKS